MKRIALVFSILGLGLTFSAQGSIPTLRSILTATTSLFTQSVAGSRACGPTALLYALKLGNDVMQTAFSRLPGSADEEKLKNLVSELETKPSLVKYHHFRLEPNDGMSPQDLYATATDFAGLILQAENLSRKEGETQPGKLLRRVYSMLKNSVANKVPVVAIIVPYVGTDHKWRERNGHYVVITGLSEKLEDSSTGFMLQYLDPETGRAHQAYINEELQSGFWARRENQDGSGEWIHHEVKTNRHSVPSPYLKITAPDLNMGRPEGESQRVVLALLSAIGKFGP